MDVLTANRIADLVFIADLNELEDGDLIPVALDFTTNFGPFVTAPVCDSPQLGQTIRLLDDEGSILEAEIVEIKNGRDLVARIDWATERHQTNRQVNFAVVMPEQPRGYVEVNFGSDFDPQPA